MAYQTGKDAQRCQVATLRLVLTYLQTHLKKTRNHTGYAPEARDVRNAVCKRDPVNARQVIIAVVYTDQIAEQKYDTDRDAFDSSASGNPTPIELAVVDTHRDRVVASGAAQIESQSPNPEIDATSVRLDTARYDLAKGVRAFGVDASDGYNPNCGDGFIGPNRYLYVREGKHIRPVLRDVMLSHDWVMQQSTGDRCHQDNPKLKDVVEHGATTIGVAKTTTNGWHDLWLARVFWINDESIGGRCRVKLRFDGKSYPSGMLLENSDVCGRAEDRVIRAAAKRFHVKGWEGWGAH